MQEPIKDSARFSWHEVVEVALYRLDINATPKPMSVKEERPQYGGKKS
ncbi:MAG: hypothetical protein ABIA75_13910 [Candidatus Neomarinimicrobiota bacterium]